MIAPQKTLRAPAEPWRPQLGRSLALPLFPPRGTIGPRTPCSQDGGL